jgi:WD40 repeat protein
MTVTRLYPTATLLPSGKVVIVGGWNGTVEDTTADIYDPAAGTFTASANRTTSSHYGGVAATLPNGDVLLAGGFSLTDTNATDIYGAADGKFRPTARMKDARELDFDQSVAAQLQNGLVLVAGGYGNGTILTGVEFFVSSIGITTLALPDGALGQPYSATLAAAGGTGNLTWTLSSGVLPPGLMLSANGAISGTPTAVGTFSFTVSVADSGSPVQTDSKQFSIRVVAAAPGAMLSFSVQPTTTEAGVVIAPTVAVLVQTTAGPAAGVTVTLTLGTNPSGAALAGDTAVTSGAGIAVFPGLSVSNVGPGYTLVASVTGFPSAVSTAFDVTPVTPFLSFVTQPVTGPSFPAKLPAIEVLAANRNGVPLLGINIDLRIGTRPCPFDSNAFGSGTTDESGIATITNAYVMGGGAGATLIAYAIGGSPVTSNPFNVSGFCQTGFMTTHRGVAASTVLPSGKVLVSGGEIVLGGSPNVANTAETYDPVSGVFTATGSMSVSRFGHTSTLLPNGLVLVVGGGTGIGVLNSAELYDPTSGTFSLTGAMASGRQFHRATLLPNGKVLITGGFTAAGNTGATATAALYDPVTGTFSPTGSMNVARALHTATLLPNGKVLIAGGTDGAINTWNTAEIYDPAAGTFTLTGTMVAARNYHTATLLANGKVLLAGGASDPAGTLALANAEIYDPSSGSFAATGSLTYARFGHTATLLANGKVLIAAGGSLSFATYNSELC